MATATDIHKHAAALANKHDIKWINNKAQYKNADLSKDTPLRQQYDKEHQQAYVARVQQASKEVGVNPSGNRELKVNTDKEGNWDVSVAAVKHDAFGGFHKKKIKIKHHQTTGRILMIGGFVNANGDDETNEGPDADDAPASVGASTGASTSAGGDAGAAAHGENFVDDFLEHYGVKGMKWGVHRNSGGAGGGSVSTKAKAKVNEAKTAIKKDIAERKGTETTVRAKPGQMVRVVGGVKRMPHQDAVAARIAEQVAKKNSLDALSNKDLQHLVNRMNLEAQYRNLAVKETRQSAGEKAIAELISKKGDVAFAKLGPHAALGKQVVNQALKMSTSSKAMAGGKVKDDKKKDN